MDAETLLALVDGVRSQLEQHPKTFQTKALRGKPVAARALAPIEEKLGVALPALLREIHTALGAFGFYWSVRPGAKALDPDESPSGQIELMAPASLRWARGADRVLRFTNDGFGNGFALDYRAGNTPTLVWYDHDHPEQLTPLRDKTLGALFARWAKELFVCTESDGHDLDPVLALLRPKKTKAPTSKKPPKKSAAPSSDLAKKLSKLRGLEAAIVLLDVPRNATMLGVAFDGDRAFLAGTSGELFVVDLTSGVRLAKQSALGSVRDLLRLPDGRLLVAASFDVEVRDVPAATSSPWFPDGASRACLVRGGSVALAADKGVRVVRFDGKVLQKIPAKNVFAMTVLGDLLVTTHPGDAVEVAAWELGSGKRRWITKEQALSGHVGIVADEERKRFVIPLVGGGLVAWDARGARLGAPPTKDARPHPSVAANATRILGGDLGTFEIIDREGKLRVSLGIRDGTYIRPHVHPDGRRAVVVGDGFAIAVDLPKLEALRSA